MQSPPPVEVMRFGRSGFTQTDQLWLLLNELKQFSPDVVVVCFLPFNDIEDVRRETAPDHERPFSSFTANNELQLDTQFNTTSSFKIKSMVDVFKRNSALVSLLAERFLMYKLRRDIDRQTMEVAKRAEPLPGYLSLCTSKPDSQYAVSYVHSKTLLEKRQNAALLQKQKCFCSVSTPKHTSPNPNVIWHSPTQHSTRCISSNLQELSSALQIHYLGLQSIFREAYLQHGPSLHWGHWNYEGHRVVAEALRAKLDQIINQQTAR